MTKNICMFGVSNYEKYCLLSYISIAICKGLEKKVLIITKTDFNDDENSAFSSIRHNVDILTAHEYTEAKQFDSRYDFIIYDIDKVGYFSDDAKYINGLVKNNAQILVYANQNKDVFKSAVKTMNYFNEFDGSIHVLLFKMLQESRINESYILKKMSVKETHKVYYYAYDHQDSVKMIDQAHNMKYALGKLSKELRYEFIYALIFSLFGFEDKKEQKRIIKSIERRG